VLWLPQRPDPDGRFVFGDGAHPTTRLCAGALDQVCRARAPGAVLDVGTGSGILARLARARGARFVAGTDVDGAAIRLARANDPLDGVEPAIVFGDHPPDHWGARFDVVVANILEGPLAELAPAIAGALGERGVVLLSGFTSAQSHRLRAIYADLALDVVREARLQDWSLLMLERRD
jgi:ribosomal protein L11 methyltransferase